MASGEGWTKCGLSRDGAVHKKRGRGGVDFVDGLMDFVLPTVGNSTEKLGVALKKKSCSFNRAYLAQSYPHQ